MIKPITEKEKLSFTLKVQINRGIDELLWQLIDEKYNGFVDIWPEIKTESGKVVLEIKSERRKTSSGRLANQNALRYHVLPEQGVKRIKT